MNILDDSACFKFSNKELNILPFDESYLSNVYVNYTAVRQQSDAIVRRAIPSTEKVAWLVRAVQLVDLTTLTSVDGLANVSRLCAKALRPVRADVCAALHIEARANHVGAVCVYPNAVPIAARCLYGKTGRLSPGESQSHEVHSESQTTFTAPDEYFALPAIDVLATSPRVSLASVATGFPTGQYPLASRVLEVRRAVEDGANEIDIVLDRALVLTGDWRAVYEELVEMRKACGQRAHLKAILGVGELGNASNIYRASWVSMLAGADFIKTSTGKESVNANFPAGLIMLRALRDFYRMTGRKVGFKPAGGIRTSSDALKWMLLVREAAGAEWLQPRLFRLGASALLTELERDLHRIAFPSETTIASEFAF